MMELAEICAVLVKENGTHVGIITDRDFATKIAANNLPFDTPVEKIMSSPLVTIIIEITHFVRYWVYS